MVLSFFAHGVLLLKYNLWKGISFIFVARPLPPHPTRRLATPISDCEMIEYQVRNFIRISIVFIKHERLRETVKYIY